MNRPQRLGDAAGAATSGALQFLMTFAGMAAAEWRKLVAEVHHAFTHKRIDAAAIEDRQRAGK
jgi:hypothetical protein